MSGLQNGRAALRFAGGFDSRPPHLTCADTRLVGCLPGPGRPYLRRVDRLVGGSPHGQTAQAWPRHGLAPPQLSGGSLVAQRGRAATSPPSPRRGTASDYVDQLSERFGMLRFTPGSAV